MKDDRVLLQTRVPLALKTYMKAFAKHHSTTLESVCQQWLQHFIDRTPWQAGFIWRVPLSHRTQSAELQGWSQFNVLFPAELAAQVLSTSQRNGVSRATVLYSSFVWFAKFISPPEPQS
jgi:hypothetical protein